MNRWSAIDVAIVILAASVFFAIAEPYLLRISTGYALSDNSANVINTYTQSVGVGILLLINKKMNEKKE